MYLVEDFLSTLNKLIFIEPTMDMDLTTNVD